MARHRRTLEDQLADSFSQNRAAAGVTYSTPAMTPIDGDLILPNAVSWDKLHPDVQAELGDNQSQIADLNTRLDTELPALDSRLTSAQAEVDQAQIDVAKALNDAASANSAASSAATAASTADGKAVAAQTKANQATTDAATAKSAADAAASAASTADGKAVTAQNTANGKNKVTYSTNVASGANTAGDVWFQKDANGVILAQWEGLGGTSWSQKTIAGAVIAALDAGKITTGTLAAAVLDASVIRAKFLAAGKIVAADVTAGTITGDEIAANAITASKILAGEIQTAHMVAGSINADRLVANSITADRLSATAIDGKTITGADIWTTRTSGAVAGHMGPNVVKADASPAYTGIGFNKVGSAAGTYDAGMYSVNGDDLNIAQGGGSPGMAYMKMSGNALSAYSYAPMDLSSRGILSLEGGKNGAAALAGVYIKGSRNQVDGETFFNNNINVTTINGGNTLLQHAEFTSSQVVPSGQNWGAGTFNLDSANSVNPNFCRQDRVDGMTILETGVYNVDMVIDTSANTANYTMCIIRRQDGSLICGMSKPVGSWEFNANSSNVYLTAGTELRITYAQSTGANQTWSGRLRITKVGALTPAGQLPTDSLTLANDLTVRGLTKTAYVAGGTPKRPGTGIIQRIYATTGAQFGTTDSALLQTAAIAVRPRSLLRVTAQFLGSASVDLQWSSWYLKANNVTFYQYGHFAYRGSFGQGTSFTGYYEVPTNQTSASFTLSAQVSAGGGVYNVTAPSPPNYLMQMNIEDVGDY